MDFSYIGFWQNKEIYDVNLVFIGSLWILILFILYIVPHYIGTSFNRIFSSKDGIDMNSYINRFIPFWLFASLVHVGMSLAISTISYIFISKTDYSYIIDYFPSAYIFILSISALILSFILIQVLVRYIFYYIFEIKKEYIDDINYLVIFIEFSILIMLSIFLIFSTLISIEYIYIIVLLFAIVIFQISSMIVCFVRLLRINSVYIYLFLYLCSLEILPYAYAIMILDRFIGK